MMNRINTREKKLQLEKTTLLFKQQVLVQSARLLKALQSVFKTEKVVQRFKQKATLQYKKKKNPHPLLNLRNNNKKKKLAVVL